jgi:hypothetical protein
MQRAAVVGLAIASILSACTGTPLATASPSSTPDRLADLRRPLRATALSSGSACPVDHGIYAAEFPGSQGFAPGIGYVAYGPGPVAPAIMASPEAAALSFTKMAKQDGRALEKIIWIVAPGTVGPILVRVVAADGSRATFMNGSDLELAGPGTYPAGYVYFPKPECYTFQVDHSRGTQRITLLVGP